MAVSGPYDAALRILSDLPCPRPVRMSFKGQFTALLAVPPPFVLLAYIAYDWRRHFPFDSLSAVLLGLTLLLASFLWLRPCLRHRRLVSEGTLAVGEVIEVLDSPRNPWVRYEFETPLGERLRRLRRTYRVDLARGMKVPVFYDPQTPQKQVALCSSYYEVPLPGEVSRRGLEWLEWTSTILVVVVPLVLLVRRLGRSDLTSPAIIIGSILAVAIKAAGNMHKRWWFWATMIPVAGAHVLFLLRFPMARWVPAHVLTSLAIGDLVIIFLLLKFVAKLVGDDTAVRENFPDQNQIGG